MAAPNPSDFSYFLKTFNQNLDDFSNDIKKTLSDERVQKKAMDCLDILRQTAQSSSLKKLDKREMQQALEINHAYYLQLKSILASQNIESKFSEKVIDRVHNLNIHMQDLLKLSVNWDELAKLKQDTLFQNPDFLNEFIHLIENGDSWALNIFKKKLSKNDPVSFEILWQVAYSNSSLFDELKGKLKNAAFREVFLNLLNSLKGLKSDDLRLNKNFLKVASSQLKESEKIWIYESIEKCLDKYPSEILLDFLKQETVNKQQSLVFFNFIIKALEDEKAWAVQVVEDHLLSKHIIERLEISNFITHWLNASLKNSEKGALLTSFISVTCKDRALIVFLKKYSEKFSKSESFDLKLFSKMVNWADDLKKIMLKNDRLKWSLTTTEYKVFLVKELLMRKVRLINFLVNKIQGPLDPAPSDFLVRPESLFFGADELNVDIGIDLSKKLSKDNIPVRCINSSQNSIIEYHEENKNLQYIDGLHEPGEWVRDFFFVQKNNFRLPAYVPVKAQFIDFALAVRTTRLVPLMDSPEAREELSKTFPINNRLLLYPESLQAFEYMKQISSIPKERSFSISYVEGGNAIRGCTAQGESYAIVGADSYALTYAILLDEIKELGLKNNEEGNWELGDSYTEKEHTVSTIKQISNKLVEQIIAHDLGVKKVYIVDQPHYHLDVSMAFADDTSKKVFLNDSMEAAKLSKEFVLSVKKPYKEGISDEVIAERIEHLFNKAQRFQIWENLCARELESVGFEVIRVPGNCVELQRRTIDYHQVNFFNHLTYLNSEDEGEIILLGCNDFFQERFKKIISEHMPKIQKEPLFLNETDSKSALYDGGGIHCMAQFLS